MRKPFMSYSRLFLLMLASTVGLSTLWPMQSLRAAEPVDLAREAESLARQGDMEAALERIREASEALWDLQPFVLKNAGFTDGSDAKTLKSGQTLSVAANLSGFGYGGRVGSLTVDFAVDLEIRHETGRSLAAQRDFATITQAIPRRLADFNLELSVATPPLRDGLYELVFTVRDLNSGGTGDFVLPFTIDGVAD